MHSFITRTAINRRQRGDTLVEVMISIAIVSLILGGAYVTTNRSLQATRAAQERAIALKLAEAQLERLKNLMSTNAAAVMAAPSPFCISYTTSLPVDDTNQDCALSPDGVRTTQEPVFRLSITRSGNNFVLTEQWVNVSGKNTDSLQLRYRVYD